jgi:hypothetical protein
MGPDYKFTLLTENAFGSDAAKRIGTTCWDHAFDLETEPAKWRLVWATLDSRKRSVISHIAPWAPMASQCLTPAENFVAIAAPART